MVADQVIEREGDRPATLLNQQRLDHTHPFAEMEFPSVMANLPAFATPNRSRNAPHKFTG